MKALIIIGLVLNGLFMLYVAVKLHKISGEVHFLYKRVTTDIATMKLDRIKSAYDEGGREKAIDAIELMKKNCN